MKPENLIAYRYLRSRKRTGVLSFLSITSVIGIMLGVASLIIVVSVMSGFSDNLKNKLLGANSDIIVSRYDNKPIAYYNEVMEEIAKVENVKGVSGFIMGQVLLSSDKNVTGVVLKGIDPKYEKDVSLLPTFMIAGKIEDLENSNEDSKAKIILGKDLAVSLGVRKGSEITVISPYGNRGPFGINPKMKKFLVSGIFDAGIHEYNATMAYISIEAAQGFLNIKGVSGFSVSAKENTNLDILSGKINLAIGIDYFVRDWLSMNSSLFSAIELEKFAMFVILTLIIIVASFNIISMIAITIKDKRKDIAILRACGGSSKFITRIFMKQGLIVGITGTVLGDILALVISFLLKHFKIIELPQEVYYMDKIPVNIDFSVYLLVTVCSVAITFFATIFPSRQAAKLSPIEALRND